MSKKKRARVIDLSEVGSLKPEDFESKETVQEPQAQRQDAPPPVKKEVAVVEKPERRGEVTYVAGTFKIGTLLPSYYIIKDMASEVTYLCTGKNYEEELCLGAQVLFRHTGERNGKFQGEITEITTRPEWAREISGLSLFCEGPVSVAYTTAELFKKYEGSKDILADLEKDNLELIGKTHYRGGDLFLFNLKG